MNLLIVCLSSLSLFLVLRLMYKMGDGIDRLNWAAEKLEKEGISVGVINNSTIKPIDKKTLINAAKKTKAVVTAEENQITGGLGSAVSEVLSQNFQVPMKIVDVKDR